jgi:hypothetical protein
LVDNLSRDLCRARDKRDALASHGKIVLAYSVFQNGCLEASRQKKNHLKIGAAQQQRERLNKKKFGGKFASEKVLNSALPSAQSMHSADSSGHSAPGNARRKVIQRDAARAKGFCRIAARAAGAPCWGNKGRWSDLCGKSY